MLVPIDAMPLQTIPYLRINSGAIVNGENHVSLTCNIKTRNWEESHIQGAISAVINTIMLFAGLREEFVYRCRQKMPSNAVDRA